MNYSKGFTLIELMIVVIVIGLLAAIAIPSYNEYYRKKDRSVAQQEMLKIAAELDRYRSKQFSYKGFDAAYLYTDSTGQAIADYQKNNATVSVPINQTEKKYTIKITDRNGVSLSGVRADGFGWAITATRKDTTKQALNYDLYLNNEGVRCMTRTENAISNVTGCGSEAEAW